MLRSLVLDHYCNYGNKEAIEEAQRRFEAHVNKSSIVASNLRGVVFGASMANGDDTTFDHLVKVQWQAVLELRVCI